MNNSKIVFLGTPEFAVSIFGLLLSAGWEIPLALTQPDRPRGRSNRPVPSPLAEVAEAAGVAVVKPEKVAGALPQIKAADPALLVVAAYGQLLPPAVLQAAPHGALNVHASLLPAYRGASPIQQAILDGGPETGATVMLMDEGLDTGPILSQTTVPISPEDTAGSLSRAVANAGGRLLVEVLPGYLAGSLQPASQPAAGASYARQLNKTDGQIDWSQPAEKILRQVRAMQPWPGAWTQLGGETMQVVRARELSPGATPARLEPGVFGAAESLEQPDISVGTGTEPVVVTTLKPAGKSAMAAEQWLRGYRGAQGQRFG